MKTTSTALRSHLDGELTTLATCWRLARLDGLVLGYTDHDRDLLVDGVTYLASSGYTRTAIANQSGMAVDNLDLAGVIDHDTIKPEEVRAGLFDYAEVRIFLVNWADLSQGQMLLRRGRLGEVGTAPDDTFQTELRGLAQALAQNVGEVYQTDCRADFGDARCKKDLAPLRAAATVTQPVDRRTVFASCADARAVDGWFNGGLARFLSGPNAGKAIEIRSWTQAGNLVLHLPAPYLPAAGDTLDLTPGCDRTRDACIRWGNIINYRGEPLLPGRDEILKYPDATG
ncbi:DUF2163 domain-containing protein [Inquilinus limosus]|uniref:Bacteriophage phiJL001 Gp84 C-terminal domain-containing protein n=1 Tax=Inquilinus limosus MP06 TaxID=1398085 RepID=A0A0A0DCP7_9PROT|nr:DUF2163 domain-containing protein [Inquilinus limosus]KGM34772.1 hypothetical protein P409_08390 [Inquilinus limosus MP06]